MGLIEIAPMGTKEDKLEQICDYLEEKPSISDPLELEILDLLRPLPEHYKRYIRDNIQSLIREFPATPDSEDKI